MKKKLNRGAYSLKALKYFQGRDGYGMNANLYNGTKKIATLFDAGDGGELSIDFENTAEAELLYSFILSHYKENEDIDTSNSSSTGKYRTFEDFLNLLSYEETEIKDTKKDRNKKTFFELSSEDAVRHLVAPYSEKAAAFIRKKYPNSEVCIWNELYEIYPDGYIGPKPDKSI